jgi:hypothetical protein
MPHAAGGEVGVALVGLAQGPVVDLLDHHLGQGLHGVGAVGGKQAFEIYPAGRLLVEAGSPNDTIFRLRKGWVGRLRTLEGRPARPSPRTGPARRRGCGWQTGF